jgi:hypothetical protein
MATLLKRINVSFPADVHAAILECSTVSGIAASQIVSLLMANTLPVLQSMTKAFRVARVDPTQAMRLMGDLADESAVAAAQVSLKFGSAASRRKPRRTTRRD